MRKHSKTIINHKTRLKLHFTFVSCQPLLAATVVYACERDAQKWPRIVKIV